MAFESPLRHHLNRRAVILTGYGFSFSAIEAFPPHLPAELALIREYDSPGSWTSPPKVSAIDP
jgi:hypothetical protein